MARTNIGLAVLGVVATAWGAGGTAWAQHPAGDAPAPEVTIMITVEETQAQSAAGEAIAVPPPPPAVAPLEPAPSATGAGALGSPAVFVGVPTAPFTYPSYAPPLAASPTARLETPTRRAHGSAAWRTSGVVDPEVIRDEPPSDGRRVGRMFLEAGLGLVGMTVGAIGGALLGLAPCTGGGSSSSGGLGGECIATIAGGMVLGAGFGTPAGITLAGMALDGNGGYGWTLLGTSAGFLLAGAMAGSLDDGDDTYALVVLPLIGGIAGYELSSDTSASYAERHARPQMQASVAPTRGGAAVSVSGVF